jgi:hypothetical protein
MFELKLKELKVTTQGDGGKYIAIILLIAAIALIGFLLLLPH